MTSAKLPSPLRKRGPSRGQEFYAAAMDKYEFSSAELQILVEVCRLLDSIDFLQAFVERDGGATGSTPTTPRRPLATPKRRT